MKYIQGPGLIASLGSEIAYLGKKGAFIIAGNSAISKYGQAIRSGFADPAFKLVLRRFGGECCRQEIDALCAELKAADCDVVVGMGGGKALDTAKAVAYYSELPVAIMPTAASSDAPCSALSVLYTPDGRFEQYLVLKNNPEAVILDSSVVAEAPVRLLVAGMGDALATYYEARACHQSGAMSIAGGACSETALAIARTCRDLLLTHGLRARIAVENGFATQAVEAVIEANTYLSGVGFESGGLAAAHAIHNGLTVLEETHTMLHGEKVAFGALVQLVLENAPQTEVLQLIDFCRSVGLPTSLAQLDVASSDKATIMKVAQASCAEGETIHNMPFAVQAEDVCAAILVADRLGGSL